MAVICYHFAPDDSKKRCLHYIDNGACSRPDRFMCSEWERLNGHTPPYKNRHLSHSRLHLYGQCPLAFYRRYVDPTKPKGRPAAVLTFGKIVHRVLELVMLHHVKEELDGPLDLEIALKFYHQEWTASYLTGADLFEEGARQLRSAIRGRGPVSHWDILGVELAFEIPCPVAPIIGYIDLIERDPEVEDGLIVTDYKTGALPAAWAVDASMQLTIYDVAARRLYPWAKSVKLCLHQTRQGLHLWTTRTDEQRAGALAYFEALGARTEADTTWEAQAGAHCSWCPWRLSCAARAALLAEDVPPGGDLDGIAAEHLRLEAQKKVITARMRETEAFITAALSKMEKIKAGGATWCQWPVEGLSYSVAKLRDAFKKASIPTLEAEKCLSVDKEKLKRVLNKHGAAGKLLKLELDAGATKRIYPRLWGKR